MIESLIAPSNLDCRVAAAHSHTERSFGCQPQLFVSDSCLSQLCNRRRTVAVIPHW